MNIINKLHLRISILVFDCFAELNERDLEYMKGPMSWTLEIQLI